MKKDQYALITGATSGIGYELAKIFAKEGYNLVIVARTSEELTKKKKEFESFGVKVVSIPKDLFEENSATELYEEVKNQKIEINVLVNDAGQGVYGIFTDTDIEKQMKIIHLNIVSLTTLTYLFLKDMIKRDEGKILQLASLVSEVPSPWQSVYGGTKAYVLSFTEALIREVKDSKVTITALQPGATQTDFFNKAGAQNSKIVQGKMADPADVAMDGYKALMNGDDKVVSGMKNKIQSAMSNIMTDKKLADQMYEQSKETDQ